MIHKISEGQPCNICGQDIPESFTVLEVMDTDCCTLCGLAVEDARTTSPAALEEWARKKMGRGSRLAAMCLERLRGDRSILNGGN